MPWEISSERSVYLQLVDIIKQKIRSGEYQPGQRLASVRELAAEAAVNPNVPDVGMPFAICHEMAHRMCIVTDADADFSAFLSCQANSSIEFQYSAYLMAYRSCINAMKSINSNAANAVVSTVSSGVSDLLAKDLDQYNRFSGEKDSAPTKISGLTEEGARETACDLLVSWYIQEFILPNQVETETKFDPFDESKVDLTGIVNAKKDEAANATDGQ